MSRSLEHLRKAGLRIGVDEAVRTECLHVAGLFADRGAKLVGLLPAAADVGVPAVALQLGRALVDLTGAPIAVIDAASTWPASEDLEGQNRSAPSLFAMSWVVENLAVLVPRTFDIGGMLIKLEAALRDEASLFGTLLVDLTGLEALGEHLAAIGMMDTVLILARAGRTTEAQLERWARDVPPDRNVGVLLVGA